jgi:Ca2+-transporting ATPase
MTASEVLAALGTEPIGLQPAESAARLDRYGPNELVDNGTKSRLAILWDQVSAVMVLILIGATVLSAILGKYLEAGTIGAIVVLFVLLGYFQEYRAEQAIAALRQMAVPLVRALRGGSVTELAATELVPGDIVLLEAGSVVPADLRLIETASLRVQESALTGESEAIDKITDTITDPDAVLGDRANMAYSGTQVTYGRGSGVVVATGMATELGNIATLIQEVTEERTPLQDRLDSVGKNLAVIGILVALIVVAMGAMSGEDPADLVLTAISVAVAVIPEGLPAVVTFTLAIGAQRMLKRNSLIRRLPAVETLGSVDIICSDKTGTLTQNKMTVAALEVAGGRVAVEEVAEHPAHHPAAIVTLAAGALCNDGDLQTVEGETVAVGDPTETAILQAAHEVGINLQQLRVEVSRAGELPFDSERKRMTTLHSAVGRPDPTSSAAVLNPIAGDEPLAFVKGAVDGLLPLADGIWTPEGVVPIDDTTRRRVEDANSDLAQQGMRVLAVAFRAIPEHLVSQSPSFDVEQELILLGLVGIIDPPRPEVREAVARCKEAGIRPVMITGDHPLTAAAIAEDLGISNGTPAITGRQLDELHEKELVDIARTASVFARVSPEHKLRLVEAMRGDGSTVAMTGDGVNDAPALKRADIGVAMGITGTDVSKEAADMVLRDDNFATIVAAVEEGRVIYDNLRRFVSFAVAGNLGKIIVMLLWPIPFLIDGIKSADAVALLPLQLLWLNLMTDGLLGLSMGLEPAEPRVMQRPPHHSSASIWAGGLGRQTAWIGVVIGVSSLVVGYLYHTWNRPEWQSMMFTTLAFMQIAQAIGTRSATESLRTIGLFTNRAMVTIASLVLGLQLLALYTPLNKFLDLEPLPAGDLALCGVLGVGLLALLEVQKTIRRRLDAPAMNTLQQASAV